MKSIFILLSFLTIFFTSGKSQNLEFSRVILIDGDVTQVQTFTVPAGKIWKLESYESASYSTYIKINNIQVYFLTNLNSTTGFISQAPTPIWFPENTTIQADDICCTVGWLSIIEFTIVP